MATSAFTFGRAALLFAILASCLVGLAAQPAPDPARKAAEATYQDVYGATHAKLLKSGRASDKADFAKKLIARAKEAGVDPALQTVLRENALLFVSPNDPTSVALAVEVYRGLAGVPGRRAESLEKLAEWTERSGNFAPAADRPKLAAEVIQDYRDAAAEYERNGQLSSALAALAKARTAQRRYFPAAKDALAALDSEEKRLRAIPADQADIDRLVLAVAKDRQDRRARLALGIAHLRRKKYPEAGEQFTAVGEVWGTLATVMAANPRSVLAIAEAAGRAGTELPEEDRKGQAVVLEYAARQYEAVRIGDPAAWPKHRAAAVAVLERWAAAESNGRGDAPLTAALLDLAWDQLDARQTAEAQATLAKVRVAVRGCKPLDAKDFQAELEVAEKVVRKLASLAADAEQFAAAAKDKPLDAKASLAHGMALLRLGRPAEATGPLSRSEVKEWVAVAELLGQGEKASSLSVGDALRTASALLRGEDKTAVQLLARKSYQAFLMSAPDDAPERGRVALTVKELPATPATWVAPSASRVGPLLPDVAATTKWFEATPKDAGTVTVTADGSGVRVAVKGTAGDCNFPTDRIPEVAEAPTRPAEIRYAGYWYRKDGGINFDLTFRTDKFPQLVYASGTTAATTATADRVTLALSDRLPTAWTFVVHDLYADFGRPVRLIGLTVGARDDGTSHLGPMVLGPSYSSVRAAGLKLRPN